MAITPFKVIQGHHST